MPIMADRYGVKIASKDPSFTLENATYWLDERVKVKYDQDNNVEIWAGDDRVIIIPNGVGLKATFVSDTSSGISSPSAADREPQFAVSDGKLDAANLPENSMVRIFSLDGKLVSTGKVQGGRLSMPLPHGMSIVNINGKTIKIQIR